MLAKRDYNIESKYIKIPGMVNVISFGLGFVLLAIAVAIKVINA
jgi:hypothetical protein